MTGLPKCHERDLRSDYKCWSSGLERRRLDDQLDLQGKSV